MTDIASRASSRQGSRRPDVMVLTFGPDRVDGLAEFLALLGLPSSAAPALMRRLGAGMGVTLHGPRGREVRLVAGGRP